MFSENYIVVDKHSLTKGEYVSTIERMPWLYTSLYDPQYLPVLDEAVASKLNAFFRYRFPHPTDEPILDDRKVLRIEHVDGDIKAFDCRSEISYSVLSANDSVWKNFIHSVQCEEIDNCRSKIDKITDETDVLVTKISGIEYEPDGSFRSIGIYDDTYNLDEYSSIEKLSKLNELCKGSNLMKGLTTFFPNSERLKFRINFNYPLRYNQETKKVQRLDDKFRERHLQRLIEKDLITSEQLSYINTLLFPNSKFDMEFVFDEEYNVEEIFFYVYKIYEFRDLTAD